MNLISEYVTFRIISYILKEKVGIVTEPDIYKTCLNKILRKKLSGEIKDSDNHC
jgi:hypothetical protein